MGQRGHPAYRPRNGPARHPWPLTSIARIRLLGGDYGHVLEGTDLIEFDDQQKIRTLVAFFGKVPI